MVLKRYKTLFSTDVFSNKTKYIRQLEYEAPFSTKSIAKHSIESVYIKNNMTIISLKIRLPHYKSGAAI